MADNLTSIAPPQHVTVSEYDAFSQGHDNGRFELIHGEIIEKMTTEEHAAIAALIVMILGPFIQQHALGRLLIEPSFHPPHDPHNIRIPDIAFTGNARKQALSTEGYIPYMPDLAIEIMSPSQRAADMRNKALFYLQNGGHTVWIFYPAHRMIDVCTLQVDELLHVEQYDEDSTLRGSEVLPNFSVTVRDFFNVS